MHNIGIVAGLSHLKCIGILDVNIVTLEFYILPVMNRYILFVTHFLYLDFLGNVVNSAQCLKPRKT